MAGLGIKHMYRIDEVARLFDTSRDTIYRMIEEAELTGVRVRASFRVDYLALVAKFSEEDL
jgi:excisionase family DNA binding protein